MANDTIFGAVSTTARIYENFTAFGNGTSAKESLLLYKRHIAGVALAVIGNCLISVALNFQKLAHNRLQDGANYCFDKMWWIGMITMALGEVGNFLAYGFAPASEVAPLGCVGVLANAIIAVVFLKEALSPQSVMGVSLIAVGSYVLISFSTKDHPVLTANNIETYLKSAVFITYILIEAVTFVILLYYIKRNGKETLVTLLVAVALLASITVIAAKGVSSLLSASVLTGKQHILNLPFWIMLISLPLTTVPQIRFLNRAMQLYDVSDVVPVNFIFFTLSAILAGSVFYQEFQGLPVTKLLLFVFGCLISFIGVFIIMKRGSYDPTSTKQHNDKEEYGVIGNEDSTDETINTDRENASLLPKEEGKSANFKPKPTLMLKQLVSMVKETESVHQIQPTQRVAE